MAHSEIKFRAPRPLEDKETKSSLDHWKSSFINFARRDPTFQPFLTGTWNPLAANFGFQTEGATSAEQRMENCKIFIQHVATYMKEPFWNNRMLEQATSLKKIWEIIDEAYEIETSAESFLDIALIKHNGTESYSTFLARIIYHIENNKAPGGLVINGISSGTGDKMDITKMDLAVTIWLEKIDARLIERVKIEYGVQIKQGRRLYELSPQIAKAIPSMLKKLGSPYKENMKVLQEVEDRSPNNYDDDTNVMRIRGGLRGGAQRGSRDSRPRSFARGQQRPFPSGRKQTCRHCTWLKDNWGIWEIDVNHDSRACRREMPAEVKMILQMGDSYPWPEEDEDPASEEHAGQKNERQLEIQNFVFQKPEDNGDCQREKGALPPAGHNKANGSKISKSVELSDQVLGIKERSIRLISEASSPKIRATFQHSHVTLLVDEGSNLNAGADTFAKRHQLKVVPSARKATAAGNNNLNIIGETEHDVVVDTRFGSKKVSINLGRITIIPDLGSDLILGEPGKVRNNISTNPANKTISCNREGHVMTKPYFDPQNSSPSICRIQEHTTIFPDDEVQLPVPENLQHSTVTIVPRKEFSSAFEPSCKFIEDKIVIKNISPLPVNVKKYTHMIDIRPTKLHHPPELQHVRGEVNLAHEHDTDDFKFSPTVIKISPPDPGSISTDPDNIMTPDMKKVFLDINERFREVFTTTPGRYNNYYGMVDNSLRFSTPPVQSSRVATPSYNTEMTKQLAAKMDELIDAGVLMRPEAIGVSVEHINPSLLVAKEDGTWRMVSDMTQLNKVLERHNSSNPTIRQAKADLARKKFRCELDLSNFFFQHGLKRSDTAYLAVQHPYEGLYCYTSSPQGLKNSSEQCYDLLARIYGKMMKEDRVTRMADSIFPIADSLEELAVNYAECLRKAELCNMTFKPSKTVIAPRTSTLFGWRLSDGEWTPLPHVTSSLSRTELPTTFKQLRSFLGAFKQINECVPAYSSLLSPFDKITGSRGSAEKVTWTESLKEAFEKLKEAAKNPMGVHIPRRSDKLVTSSDYSHQTKSIGGLLTIHREEDGIRKTLLGGHFSVSLDKNQVKWSACEAECLGVRATLKHFENEIRDSEHETCHLSDNIPTVLAWKKALNGKFSTSKRIAAFLSSIADYPVRLEHRPGSDLKLSDHASRNPPPCHETSCQVCDFVNKEVEQSNHLSKVFTMEETLPMEAPFLQLKTWKTIQMNDSVHSRLHALIKNGQIPLKKKTGGEETLLKNLHTMFTKRGLIVDHSGVIMVKVKNGHFNDHAISVPRNLFPGIVFAFHNKHAHPTKSQMLRFIGRYYYCTGMADIIEKVTDSCLRCTSTKKLPKELLTDSTSIPAGIGTDFSSDVLERQSQCIFVTKDNLSHFAAAVIIPDQTTASLRQGIVQTTSPMISSQGAKVRVDAAPGFKSLAASQEHDTVMKQLNLKIEIGDSLNRNKNPVGEAAIAEVKRELLALAAPEAPIDQALLSLAVRNLNNRVRSDNKTAAERLFKRDTLTNNPIQVDDSSLRSELATRRKAQHETNKNNAQGGEEIKFSKGDLVMMRTMTRLDKPRDLYIVDDILEDGMIRIRKSEKQWRQQTYRVKPSQLIKVFNSDPDQTKMPDPADPAPNFRSRLAKSKARMTMQQQSRANLTTIKEGIKKKNRGIRNNFKDFPEFVDVIFSWPAQAQDSPLADLSTDTIRLEDHLASMNTSSTLTPDSSANRDQDQSMPFASMSRSLTPEICILDSPVNIQLPVLIPQHTSTSIASLCSDHNVKDAPAAPSKKSSESSAISLAWDEAEESIALQDPLETLELFPSNTDAGDPRSSDAATEGHNTLNAARLESSSDDPLALDNVFEDEASQPDSSPDVSPDDQADNYVPSESDSDSDGQPSSPPRTRSHALPDVKTASESSSASQAGQFSRDGASRQPLSTKWSKRNVKPLEDLAKPRNAASRRK